MLKGFLGKVDKSEAFWKHLPIICAILCIAGAVLVAMGRVNLVWWANLTWVFGNVGFAAHNLKIDERAQALMFSVFTGISAFGVVRWW